MIFFCSLLHTLDNIQKPVFYYFLVLKSSFFPSNKTLPINLCWKPRSYFVMKIVTSNCIIFTRKFTCRNAEFLNWLFFFLLWQALTKSLWIQSSMSHKNILKIIVYSQYYNPFSCFNINKKKKPYYDVRTIIRMKHDSYKKRLVTW